MKLSIFDLPRGSKHYVRLPSGRCINVHVATDNETVDVHVHVHVHVHVQVNSEQWPAIYSDSFTHCASGVTIYHSASKCLTHSDIAYLQTYFPTSF